jgi:2-iminobutanoate/2-iminopropanoate deaminase
MQFITTPKVPAPGGHYSQGVEAGGFVFVSGMLPGPPAPGETDSFERQVRATLGHCRAVLEAAACSFADVVQVTAYLVGIERWPEFNTLYAQAFAAHRPARAVVPVPHLHHDYLIEIQMVAQRPGPAGRAAIERHTTEPTRPQESR